MRTGDSRYCLDGSREPCLGCAHAPRCAAERLACSAFSSWVEYGRIDRRATRTPSARVYRLLFEPTEQPKA
jgi:hypothetical protein